MQDAENHDVVTLENQITERYGLLISQTQLAELLGRTTGGLRYPLRLFGSLTVSTSSAGTSCNKPGRVSDRQCRQWG